MRRWTTVLWLDADDILLPKIWNSLLELKRTLDPAVDLVMMRYNTAFDSQGSPHLFFPTIGSGWSAGGQVSLGGGHS
jgi:hypothetical protein